MWPFSKKVSIIKKSYVIGDKLFFKKPLVHPATQELIGFGTIQDISKNEILLYLADGCDTGENSYCQSWLKSFKKRRIRKHNIKQTMVKYLFLLFFDKDINKKMKNRHNYLLSLKQPSKEQLEEIEIRNKLVTGVFK